MTDQLFDKYKIAALGLDVVFAKKEENYEIDALREVAKKRGRTSFITELDTDKLIFCLGKSPHEIVENGSILYIRLHFM